MSVSVAHAAPQGHSLAAGLYAEMAVMHPEEVCALVVAALEVTLIPLGKMW